MTIKQEHCGNMKHALHILEVCASFYFFVKCSLHLALNHGNADARLKLGENVEAG